MGSKKIQRHKNSIGQWVPGEGKWKKWGDVGQRAQNYSYVG